MSVTLHTTLGDLKIEVCAGGTGQPARNFLALCASGAYTNSPFHRGAAGFMVQGGGRAASRKSRAAWTKRLPDDIVSGRSFSRAGVVAFANKGAPSPTGVGSQFFITLAPAPHLDGTCSHIGQLLHGLDVAEALAASAQAAAGDEGEMPRITGATIHANPFADAE